MSHLVDKLKKADLPNGFLSKTDGDYLEKHVVLDVPSDFVCVKVIFLMESPHNHEVQKHFPLAGPTSGTRVTRDLITLCSDMRGQDQSVPAGQLVESGRVPWLSIMNVSLLPLQESPYQPKTAITDNIRALLCAFGEIRDEGRTPRTPLSDVGSVICGVIVDDLTHRIVHAKSQCSSALLLVPFGNVARRTLRKTETSSDSELNIYEEEDVPHPAADKWRDYEKEGLAERINAWLNGP